jgi:hypothetical protein
MTQNTKFWDIILHLGTIGTPSTHICSWNPYLLHEQPVMPKMIMLQHEIQSGEYYILSYRMTGIVAL